MFLNCISALRIGVLAAAMLVFAATPTFAQHHGGHGGHGGHVSGYHGGYYHHGGYGYGGYYHHSYYWPRYGIGIYAWPYVSGYGYRDYYYPSYSSYYAPDYYYPPTVSGYYSPPDVNVFPPSSPASAADAATVEVRVPPDAQVWFDGNPTTQTGELRIYVSPLLPPDRAFHYDVRARWMDNGRVVDQTRSVEVRAGRRTTVDIMQPQP